jgi:phage shock protein PspC (stress-responsive transcriptional regulator)
MLSMTNPPPNNPPPTGAAPAGAPPASGEVPPITAFAWRHRLVRPVEGRTLAGVCGALARATGTDPVLWKVIIAVLTIFGGIGVVIYLLGWLFLPADGDTATPVEALAGRGWSRTSSTRTIVGLVITALFLAGYFSEPYRATPLIALFLLGGVLLLLLRDRSRSGDSTGAGAAPPAETGAGFAPHGPFAPPVPPAMPPMLPPPGRPWSAVPRPPRPPRSRLGGLTFSMAMVVIGALILVDLSGVNVPPVAYVAAPLGVIGLGLLVGTWLGRARWLIPIGIALCLAVGGGWVAVDEGHWTRSGIGGMSFAPGTVNDLKDSYSRSIGEVDLDLSELDFEGRDVDLTVRVDLGSLIVSLPPDVDVVVDATVDLGSAQVLGEEWDGLGNGPRTVTDLGRDGTGGGRLHIIASVGLGSLEIDR